MKKAKISFNNSTIGCQIDNGKMIKWQSGGSETIEIGFAPIEKLSDEVSALKAFEKLHPIYQYGNSFSYRSGFKVEIIEEVTPNIENYKHHAEVAREREKSGFGM